MSKIEWGFVRDEFMKRAKPALPGLLCRTIETAHTNMELAGTEPDSRVALTRTIDMILKDRQEVFDAGLNKVRKKLFACKQGPEESPIALAKRMIDLAEKTQLSAMPSSRIVIQKREDILFDAFDEVFQRAVERYKGSFGVGNRPPKSMFCTEGPPDNQTLKEGCPHICEEGRCNLFWYERRYMGDAWFLMEREKAVNKVRTDQGNVSQGKKPANKRKEEKSQGRVNFNNLTASQREEQEGSAKSFLWKKYGAGSQPGEKPKTLPKGDGEIFQAQIKVWQGKLCRICLKDDGHKSVQCPMRVKRTEEADEGTWGKFGKTMEDWHAKDNNAERLALAVKQAGGAAPAGAQASSS